ncbi:hypothetical protein BU17DRAFT_99777 [Hysterangium stoloniferum]|nr:hypothetical protein BU17DRAFT_99777 [Hysterangium stoloniferum]
MKVTLLSLVVILCAPPAFATPPPEANTVYTVDTKKPALHKRATLGTAAQGMACRSCPQNNCGTVTNYSKRQTISVTCTSNAQTSFVDGNPYWDHTSDNCWVPEAYITWGDGTQAPPHC